MLATKFHRSRRRLIFLVGAAHDDPERVVGQWPLRWTTAESEPIIWHVDLSVWLPPCIAPSNHCGSVEGSRTVEVSRAGYVAGLLLRVRVVDDDWS